MGIQDLHPDLLTCTLRHLDGPSLAAVGCVSSHLRSVSSDHSIWQGLCLSRWPSLRHPRLLSLFHTSHYQLLFASAFPFPHPSRPSNPHSLPRELISAVDLNHKGCTIFSRVIELDTSSSWFLSSPFRVGIDTLDEQSSQSQLASSIRKIIPSELTLSWIWINPESRKAVNVSSRSPVAIERHWYTGEILVRYGMVMQGVLIGIVVTCGEDGGHVREVSMTVEDGDGIGVCGRESLEMVMEAMEGSRKWKGNGEEETEARRRHNEFVRRRSSRKESKIRREYLLDLCCTGFSAVICISFLFLLAFT